MPEARCISFLRWVMPRLGLNWSGFQRCHRQVCKRLSRRIADLRLPNFAAYRDYTLAHEAEWPVIESCCRVTISRFYRDRAVFDHPTSEDLPRMAIQAEEQGRTKLRVWSAGCGAGEEPYSLSLAWRLGAAARFPHLSLNIVATDVDDVQLTRARVGCYRHSSLRELPPEWVDTAFIACGSLHCLRPTFAVDVHFRRQDIRAATPKGPFDLILCRNMAFTYFDRGRQQKVLSMIVQELAPGGLLVIGRRERLPANVHGLREVCPELPIFAKPSAGLSSLVGDKGGFARLRTRVPVGLRVRPCSTT